MGSEGMKASLVSREIIADSIELVVDGHLSRRRRRHLRMRQNHPRDGDGLGSAGSSLPNALRGIHPSGEFSRTRRHDPRCLRSRWGMCRGPHDGSRAHELETTACPGAGACGGQFTANTMSTAMTMLGISPMGVNDIPAVAKEKDAAAFRCGELVMALLEKDIRPSKIITRPALENRHHVGCRHRRFDQRGTSSSGDRPGGRRASSAFGLRCHRRQDTDHRRPQTRRTLHRPRSRASGRHATSGRAPDGWRFLERPTHGQWPHSFRGGEACKRNCRANRHTLRG